MKKMLPHVAWSLVVAAAFAGGHYWRTSPPLAPSESKQKPTLQTSTAAAAKSSAPTFDAIHSSAAMVEVTRFLERYKHVDGTPLTSEEMKLAMMEILTESDPIKSSLMFALILEQLTPDNASTVLAEIKARVTGMEGMRYFGLLSYKWGAVDGPGAMKEAGKQEGPGKMMGSIISLAGWASKDPAAAQAWLAKNPAGNDWERSAMERGLVGGLSRNDPAGAEKYVSSIKDNNERARLTQVLMEEKLKQGTDAAASWASALTDPEMKKGALQSVTEQLYRNDQKKALEYVKANAEDPSNTGAVGEVVRRISSDSPEKSIAFAQELPAGPSRVEAYKISFREWAADNPAEASTSINNLPKGGDRDAAASGLASAVAAEDPTGALVWAESIEDPAMKQDTINDTLKRAMRDKLEVAIGYMTEKGWSEEQITTLKNAAAKDNERRRGGFFGGRGFR